MWRSDVHQHLPQFWCSLCGVSSCVCRVTWIGAIISLSIIFSQLFPSFWSLEMLTNQVLRKDLIGFLCRLLCCYSAVLLKKKTPHLTFKWLRIQSPPSLPNIHILIYDCRSIWVLFENLISTWLTKRVYTFRFCSVDRKLKRIGRRNELVRLIESLCGSADLIVPSALCYYRATSKGTFEYPASHPLPPATIQRSWRAGATHPVVPFGLWFSIRTVIWWPSAPLWL